MYGGSLCVPHAAGSCGGARFLAVACVTRNFGRLCDHAGLAGCLSRNYRPVGTSRQLIACSGLSNREVTPIETNHLHTRKQCDLAEFT